MRWADLGPREPGRLKAIDVEVEDFLTALVGTGFGAPDEREQSERDRVLTSAVRQVGDANGLIGHFISLRDRFGNVTIADRGESSKLSPEGV